MTHIFTKEESTASPLRQNGYGKIHNERDATLLWIGTSDTCCRPPFNDSVRQIRYKFKYRPELNYRVTYIVPEDLEEDEDEIVTISMQRTGGNFVSASEIDSFGADLRLENDLIWDDEMAIGKTIAKFTAKFHKLGTRFETSSRSDKPAPIFPIQDINM